MESGVRLAVWSVLMLKGLPSVHCDTAAVFGLVVEKFGDTQDHTRHYLIHTHTCCDVYRVCVCVCARVLLMSERTSCHSDNKITTGMWHHMSVTCQTHVSDGSQAAAVCLPSDMLEGRDMQTDGELVHKKRHTVSR